MNRLLLVELTIMLPYSIGMYYSAYVEEEKNNSYTHYYREMEIKRLKFLFHFPHGKGQKGLKVSRAAFWQQLCGICTIFIHGFIILGYFVHTQHSKIVFDADRLSFILLMSIFVQTGLCVLMIIFEKICDHKLNKTAMRKEAELFHAKQIKREKSEYRKRKRNK